MTARREMTAAIALCILGSSVLLIAAGAAWVRYAAATGHSTAAGAAAPIARSLGLAALAGVVGIAAARDRGRIAVGFALVLVGAGAAVVAVRAGLQPVGETARNAVLPPGAAQSTAWPWVAAGGGVIIAIAGLLVAARGARWSSLARRYDGPRPAGPDSATDVGMWDALSHGDDPTAGRP